eukprot:scaffold1800_cov387-Prasinococcus_capsulatus_cf.AAC.10
MVRTSPRQQACSMELSCTIYHPGTLLSRAVQQLHRQNETQPRDAHRFVAPAQLQKLVHRQTLLLLQPSSRLRASGGAPPRPIRPQTLQRGQAHVGCPGCRAQLARRRPTSTTVQAAELIASSLLGWAKCAGGCHVGSPANFSFPIENQWSWPGRAGPGGPEGAHLARERPYESSSLPRPCGLASAPHLAALLRDTPSAGLTPRMRRAVVVARRMRRRRLRSLGARIARATPSMAASPGPPGKSASAPAGPVPCAAFTGPTWAPRDSSGGPD